MAMFGFILRAIWAFLVVGFRRLFRGPRHPEWSYRFESLAELIRNENARGFGLSPEALRRGFGATPIPTRIRRQIRHERTTFAGIPTETFEPLAWTESDPTILYLHGGGYVVCSPATHRDLIARIAVAARARCVAIDYRKAPEHPFPAAIDDAEAAYRALVASGVPESRLFVAGDSAGGGIALALMLRLKASGSTMPRAAVLLSPWVDLETSGVSINEHSKYDYLPPLGLPWAIGHYLQGQDPKHPEASAVNADLGGLPPLLIQTGGAELFYSENLALAERAAAAGVRVTHDIQAGMIHVFQAFATYAPECAPAIDRIGGFVQRELRRPDQASAPPASKIAVAPQDLDERSAAQ